MASLGATSFLKAELSPELKLLEAFLLGSARLVV